MTETTTDEPRVVSTSTIATTNPEPILDAFAAHLVEHGIPDVRRSAGALAMMHMDCLLELKVEDGAMDIRIETPSDNFMTFIRDDVVEHLGEFEPEAVLNMRWTGGVRVGELPSNFRILRAARRREVFPGLVRVTLAGIDVEALIRDGIHIKLMMPAERGRAPVWPVIGENGAIAWPQGDDKLHARFVTIRHVRVAEREIDVDIATHDGGLISTWASMDGDSLEVGVMGPGGDAALPSAENVVLAADYTGLPALARLIESVGGRVTGRLYAAAPSLETLEAYLPASGLEVTAMDPGTFTRDVAAAIRDGSTPPVGYAFFAGEFSAAQEVRAVFKGPLGMARGDQISMAYWRAGMPGFSG